MVNIADTFTPSPTKLVRVRKGTVTGKGQIVLVPMNRKERRARKITKEMHGEAD